eukprot:COSAG06_NODE_69449_length_197_cov_902.867347_1_plen_44_part_10
MQLNLLLQHKEPGGDLGDGGGGVGEAEGHPKVRELTARLSETKR